MPLLNATPPVTAVDTTQGSGIFVFDDTDEDDWVYVAQSRKSESIIDKLQRKLLSTPLHLLSGQATSSATEGEMKAFERRFMRVSIKDGHATMALFASDESTETALAYFDLQEIRNVRNLIIDEDDALPFVSIGADGLPKIENVYGHIGVRLELDSLSTAAFDRRDQSLIDASQQEHDLHALNLQRKLRIHGKATTLHIAFSSIAQRDAWSTWLSELIVLKELQNVQGRGDLAEDLKKEDEALKSPRLIAERSAMQPAVRSFIKKFLGGIKNETSEKDPPNAGKIDARGPADRDFETVLLVPRFSHSEIRLISRRKQNSISQLFANDHRHAKADGGRVLRLTDRTKIQASIPLASDFQVLLDDGGVWTFICRSAEMRNDFVRWFRFVKGRGEGLAQTDAETFTFLEKTDAMKNKAEEQMNSIVASTTEAASARSARLAATAQAEKHDEQEALRSDEDDLHSLTGPEGGGSFSSDGLVVGLDHEERRTGREKAPIVMRRRSVAAQQTAEDEFDDHHGGRVTPPSPTTSVHSVRPFTYFVLHPAECIKYVDETCQPHILGRSDLFASAVSDKKAPKTDLSSSSSTQNLVEGKRAVKGRVASKNTNAARGAPEPCQGQVGQQRLVSDETTSWASGHEGVGGAMLLPTSYLLLGGERQGARGNATSAGEGRSEEAEGKFTLAKHAHSASPLLPPPGAFSNAAGLSNASGYRRQVLSSPGGVKRL